MCLVDTLVLCRESPRKLVQVPSQTLTQLGSVTSGIHFCLCRMGCCSCNKLSAQAAVRHLAWPGRPMCAQAEGSSSCRLPIPGSPEQQAPQQGRAGQTEGQAWTGRDSPPRKRSLGRCSSQGGVLGILAMFPPLLLLWLSQPRLAAGAQEGCRGGVGGLRGWGGGEQVVLEPRKVSPCSPAHSAPGHCEDGGCQPGMFLQPVPSAWGFLPTDPACVPPAAWQAHTQFPPGSGFISVLGNMEMPFIVGPIEGVVGNVTATGASALDLSCVCSGDDMHETWMCRTP